MAVKRPTVLVVGAGASCELGFPASDGLLEEIARALDFKGDGFNLQRGDREIYSEFLRQNQNQDSMDRLWNAARRVRDAAYLGISIDNIVHQLRDDDDVAYCAKLSIVRRILEAERKSELSIKKNVDTPTWSAVRGTWLGGLAQMIVQDFQRNKLHDIFKNLTIICFNYDRNIQRFLPLALASQFAISENEAEELCRQIEIIHPYGSIGPLEWEQKDHSVPFGAERCDLSRASKNIRTFTEQTEDEASIDKTGKYISQAERVIFLGFGYISQNMNIILDKVDGTAMSVFGTSYGLSEPDVETVTGQLNILFKSTHRDHKSARLVSKKCTPFLQEHFRTFTS